MKNIELDFTGIQKQVILGSMLGDGHLTAVRDGYKNPIGKTWAKNSSYNEGHSPKQLDYLSWKAKQLSNFFNSFPTLKNNQLNTFHHKIFTDLEEKWYKRDENGKYILNEKGHRIKIVPKDLFLTPLIVAIWYLDDGTLSYKESQKYKRRTVVISTDSFNQDECLFLISRLEYLGINSYLKKKFNKKSNKIYYQIGIKSTSFTDFLDLVKLGLTGLFPPNCMNYKYIIQNYIQPETFGDNHHSTIYSNEQVLKVVELANIGKMPKEIVQKLNVSRGFVSNVLNGKTRKDITKDIIVKSNISRKNKSGFVGVHYNNKSKKWIASITKNKITKILGYFKDKDDAIIARKKAENK